MKEKFINELSLKIISRMSKSLKRNFILAVSASILLLGVFSFHKNMKGYSILKTSEQQLKTRFELKQQRFIKTLAHQQFLLFMQKKLSSMPKGEELTILLKEISKLGMDLGLTFKFYSALPEITHKFYQELPVKIQIIGNYEQFLSFLIHLTQMKFMISFSELTITPVRDNGSELIMNTTVKIYHFRIKDA